MYFKLEEGKKFHFFSREREYEGEKTTHTDKAVFGSLSEGIKVGEAYGKPIWENDSWNACFCGKAYEAARELQDGARICVTEMNIRNRYISRTKKSYPQISVFDFYLEETGQEEQADGKTQAE